MINYLMVLSFMNSFLISVPASFEEMTTVHWVAILVGAFIILLLLIKFWQKILTIIIKILFLVLIGLIIYLLVIS